MLSISVESHYNFSILYFKSSELSPSFYSRYKLPNSISKRVFCLYKLSNSGGWVSKLTLTLLQLSSKRSIAESGKYLFMALKYLSPYLAAAIKAESLIVT